MIRPVSGSYDVPQCLNSLRRRIQAQPAAGHHYVPDGKNWVDKTEFDEAKPPAEMAAFRAAIAWRENGSAEWNKEPATASVPG
jgi:hypothetical protein